jgi:hypothetical protein
MNHNRPGGYKVSFRQLTGRSLPDGSSRESGIAARLRCPGKWYSLQSAFFQSTFYHKG